MNKETISHSPSEEDRERQDYLFEKGYRTYGDGSRTSSFSYCDATANGGRGHGDAVVYSFRDTDARSIVCMPKEEAAGNAGEPEIFILHNDGRLTPIKEWMGEHPPKAAGF